MQRIQLHSAGAGLVLGALTLLASLDAVSAADSPAPSEPRSAPSLETIKALAGDWYKLNEAGEPTDEIVSSYRVTAAGNAVVETVYPGTEHEMLSVYFEDDGRLEMTHYCMLNNSPTYVAKNGAEGEIVYECIGGGNLKEADRHMHTGRIQKLGADRYVSKWTMMEAGEVAMVVESDVVRR